MGKLEKAYLQAENGADTSPIKVLFNPTEYTIERGNQIQSNALPGLATPVVQFVNGNADTLSMDLFFDTQTYDGSADVRSWTDRVERLTRIDRELHAPPVVLFVWGRALRFRAVLERVTQRFTLFREDGVPIRATLSVTFRQYATVTDQLEEIGFRSADVSRRHRLVEGEALWSLAARFYGDPGTWRDIAGANGIDDPLAIEPGRELRVPPLEETR